MKKLFTVLAALFAFIIGASSKERLIFTRISQEEGLTSTINCIYKEADGDVWIGCPSALYQFNGHTLRHREDSLLSGRNISMIDKDAKENFWVLTDNWLLKKGKSDKDFRLLRIPEMKGKTPFNTLCMDEKGIWFGSTGRLYRYTYADDRFFMFCELSGREFFNIKHICNFDNNTLLCSSHEGLIFVDKVSGKARETSFNTGQEISSLLIDSKERIWIAAYNKGIDVFDKEGKLIRQYNKRNGRLNNDLVLCMTEKDSSIWAGTDGGGINIISIEKDNTEILRHISGDISSFPAHSIKSIYIDMDGNVWAGSVRNGVIRVSSSGIHSYRDCHIGSNTGLSNPTVTCLYQDSDKEHIWIGTDGEGVNMYNLSTRKFTHLKNTLKSKIVSIASYSKDELVLSSFGEQLLIFDKKSGNLRPLPLDNETVNYSIRYSGRAINVANEADGTLLLFSNGLWRYEQENGSCISINRPDKEKEFGIYYLIGNDGNGIWLHDNSSIFYLPTGDSVLKFKGKLENETISCGDLAADGRIWLATDSGLHVFDNGISKRISTSLFVGATSVTCDNSSRVWIGSNENLFAYFIDKDSFALFGESDGVRTNEFLNKPHLKAANGDIFLGGVKGLVHIDADFSTGPLEIPRLKLYDLLIDNIETKTDDNGFYETPRGSNSVKIIVSAQEKDIFRHKIYRYMMSNGFMYETERPYLELKQLPSPGTYDILVSCTKRSGNWTEPVKIMTLRIPQPWYKSWWFILIIAISLLLIIGISITIIDQKKKSLLERAKKEQEQKIYEEKVSLLINMSHELRTPLTLIMAPLKRLLDRMHPCQENFETLNRIYRQSRRMGNLLNMVLDIRKMEVGKHTLKLENADYNSWIKEAIEDICHEEREQNIEIVADLDPSINMVCFDRKVCDTVLTNILINAIKHSSFGDSICISTRLTEDRKVRTSVSDQGPGLGDIDFSQLFDSFYQSKNEKYGSGIGLAYAKVLIDLHGGNIGAENNPDRGATFWWEIPLESEATAVNIPAKAYLNELMGNDSVEDFNAPESEEFITTKMTLMLVDDSRDLLDFLKEAMSQNFAEIITVESGNKAYEELGKGRLPDIIVSDVNMPDGNGYALCKRLKESEKYSHIPVILLTARGDQQSQGDSYRMGAEAFISKPFEIDTLLEVIRNNLKRKAEIRRRYLDNADKAVSEYGSDEENLILKLNKVIAEHISDPALDQQLLCSELGMSRASLFNKMKAITGTGAKEYITKIRLEKAKNLIETTQLSIAEISEMTGFASQSYFSTAFKAYTGVSPSKYKQDIKS